MNNLFYEIKYKISVLFQQYIIFQIFLEIILKY